MAEKILRLPQVIDLTGRSRSAIYDDIKAGNFPAPVKLGARASGWLASEVAAWIDGRVAVRRSTSASLEAQ